MIVVCLLAIVSIPGTFHETNNSLPAMKQCRHPQRTSHEKGLIMGKPATKLRKAVTAFLQARGWEVYPLGCVSRPIGNRWLKIGEVGAPDLLCWKRVAPDECKHGMYQHWYIIAIELKAVRDVQSDRQRVWQLRFESRGGCYLLVHDVNDLVEIGL